MDSAHSPRYEAAVTALAGIWRFDGRETERDLRRMLGAQSIYGQHSRDWTQHTLSMGRRMFRLLAEDSNDVGPQVCGDGALVLVADARLDNRDELATELGIQPTMLRTMADSALLMKAVDAWGQAAVDRLIGDFALVFWDRRNQQLVLARDFLGQRPLHYHRGRDFFAFASMPKGLHALADVPFGPNTNALANFLALLPESGTETHFEEIEKVQPGHIVTVSREGLVTRAFWNPPSDLLRLKDPRDYEEAVRCELDRAVKARLRGAEACIATQLSAGLDSSAVTATAARQLGNSGSLVAYTAVPRDNYRGGLRHTITDEWPLAAATAALYPNITHVKIPASGSSPLARLDRYFQYFERPVLNICNAVWTSAMLDDAQSRGLRVMLTGDAGNLGFSYTGMGALSQMVSERRWGRLVSTSARLVKGGTRVGTVAAQILGPHLPAGIWGAIGRLRGKGRRLSDYTMVSPALEASLLQAAAESGSDTSRRPPSDSYASRLWGLRTMDFGSYNKGYLGGWGIDFRDPTADRRLIELCLTIPPEQFLLDGVPRSLARRAFADRLPEAVCTESMKGYQAADWHEALSSARSEIAEEVARCSQVPEVRQLVATDRMRRLVTEWPSGGNWNSCNRIEKYRLALLRGASAAHFTRKSTGSNS